MDDVKDKMKGFMKKVSSSSSSSSSSSGKFKGQGRVLGTASTTPGQSSLLNRPSPAQPSRPKPDPKPSLNNRPSTKPPTQKAPVLDDKGFDPFGSLVTPAKRSQNGFTLNVFECPICNQPFRSEDEVSDHVDDCVNQPVADTSGVDEVGNGEEEFKSELEVCVGAFLSGKPPQGSLEVVLRLLRNVVKEPENGKFRRVRMGNVKIREAVGEVAGGVELLEAVGFALREEDGEMWAVMDVPNAEQKDRVTKVISLLERGSTNSYQMSVASSATKDGPSVASSGKDESTVQVEQKKVDRQIRVFSPVSESLAAKIELPDSFYRLSVDEVKREAEMRRKKMADSQLLIPKSYKEKQAMASRRRYTRTVIRIQFPDRVVLQGIFAPWEPTTALYEFVSAALKEQSLEFELLHPILIKRHVLPHSSRPGEKCATLEEEDLVPSALIKFKPVETESVVYTGLCNELLEISEPLRPGTAVVPL